MHAVKNWQTSAVGVAVLLLGVVGPMFGIQIPGFSMEPGTAIATAIGLIVAGDGNKP